MDKFEENKEYSIFEFYYTAKNHKYKILITTIVIFFLSTYYTLITKPVYQSSSTIMVSQDQKSMSMLDMSLGTDRNYIENEIEILKSSTTSYLTVKRLLESEYRNHLYLFNTKRYEPVYYREILTLGLLDRFQTTIDLDTELTESLIDNFTKKLLKSITISNKRNTDMIKVSVHSLNSREATLLVNTLVDVYVNRDLEWITSEMSHLKYFLIDQLSKKEEELTLIENKLKNFQEEEKIFGLDQNSSLILENLTQFEALYNNIIAQISITEEKEVFLNKQLTKDEIDFSKNVSNTINDRLYAMKNEMAIHESEMISTITKYGEEHSAVKILEEKINSLKVNIEKETRELILRGISVANPILYRQTLMDSVISLGALKANLKSKAESYKKLVNEYESKLSDLPEKVLEYTRLERIRSIHAETYSFMSKKLEESRIGEASKLGKIRIVDKGKNDSKPIKPNKLRNMFLGLLIGFISGIGLAFIIEVFDNTIKTVEQIERRNLSVLSIIPAIGNTSNYNRRKKKRYLKKNVNIEKLQRRLIAEEDPKSPVSESYRALRTSLMYTRQKSDSHLILISSSGPGEGKTTTIANLAITYANLGKKTLLIDSDLRKPVIHNVFKIDKTPGLTSHLSMNSDLRKIINHSNIDNLDIITSGIIPPNPSELLDSKQMIQMLEILKKEYDVILFDSPPLIAVTDAYILMKYVDQFALVVRAGITEKGALERVISAINQSNKKITGVVMNAMTEEYSYGSGYYYNYYQYYYNEDDK